MKRITVAPGLVLDDEMYELARIALGEEAPEQVASFTRQRFYDRVSWVRVPDVEFDDLRWYKAEFVIKHGKPYHQTIKLNLWNSPDLRRDGAPIPHNHPWPFRGVLLKGGYKEDRYEVELNRNKILVDPYQKWDVGGMDLTQGVEHVAGDVNDLDLTTFHEVTEIFEPGQTLSLMNCDLGRKDGWGHLEDDGKGNLVYVPNKLGELDTRFKPRMYALNPHLR
jgi:hypothetical protein